ncbi:hypothetical protein ElyMa_003937600 [Elysia marginata]|uniref:Uncharacterized protein n=1 Tax=Elysia marginata TaxID=1093978 RepID=A0AAV4FRT0_9GAST|nr:hypothetical protein ElyMa_003937600 [Elysia marginata]
MRSRGGERWSEIKKTQRMYTQGGNILSVVNFCWGMRVRLGVLEEDKTSEYSTHSPPHTLSSPQTSSSRKAQELVICVPQIDQSGGRMYLTSTSDGSRSHLGVGNGHLGLNNNLASALFYLSSHGDSSSSTSSDAFDL